MNRVEVAIQESRCVIAVGGRALAQPEVLMELRRRSALPIVALGADPVAPAVAVSAEALAAATGGPGGVLVLVEPEGSTDGRALSEVERLVKAGAHAPRLVVAARAYNPFNMPMGMRLLKTEQVKQRAQDFLASLPMPVAVAAPAPVAAAPAAAEPAAGQIRAPRPDLVDREEQIAQLDAWLDQPGGAIVISGPAGVGRRWLAEAALKGKADLVRLPDLAFSRAIGVDTFLARLAVAARVAGDDRLHVALSAKAQPSPADLARLVLETAQAEALANRVWVLSNLDTLLDRRDGSFYRESRLELVLKALLTSPLALKLVLLTDLQPQFHAEGLGQHLRRLSLAGLPGRTLHELFSIWYAPEFERDRFGPITERTHGHPMAARAIAVVARETPIDEVLEQPRFLKAAELTDLEALTRHLKRRVEKLEEPLLDALCAAALLREPGTAEELAVLDIKRDVRIELMSRGLLEQTPQDLGRRYYVHDLVKAQLDRRKVEDFGRMETLGQHFLRKSRDLRKGGDDTGSIALALEGNRLLVGARRARACMRLPYPDMDAAMDDIRSLIRRRKPRLDIARMRISEALKAGSTEPELLLAEAELLAAEKAPVEKVEAAWHAAQTAGATPEAFHQEASWQLARGSRGKAVEALTRGAAAFPENARMRRRLAGLLIQQGKLEEAAGILREAMELEPMMADTYSLLGEVYVGLGKGRWEDAAQVLQEAIELAPGDTQHQVRMALLLRARGADEPEQRAALWEQAEGLVRAAWQADQADQRAAVLLATITLDRVEALDAARLDQVEYILREAMKQKRENLDVIVQRARVLTRREAFRDAEELIDRVLRKAGGDASAFAARAELWEARHQPFHALEAWKAARERTQPDTAERMVADEHLRRLQVLIESGMAAAMMAERGVEPASDPSLAGYTPRKEKAFKRRKKDGEVEVAGEAQPDEGSVEEHEDGGEEDGGEEDGGEELDLRDDMAMQAPLHAADEGDEAAEEESDDDTSSSTSSSDAPAPLAEVEPGEEA